MTSLQYFVPTLCFVLVMSGSAIAQCSGNATYELTIKFMWNSNTSTSTPPGAHFSPIVLHTHTGRYSAYSRFGKSSPGVKSVAESGSTFTLREELSTASDSRLVGEVHTFPYGPDATETVTMSFTASCRYKFLSAISMVAPSPDWILAIFRLSLFKNGSFTQSRSGMLRVYDAGTDSGKTLSAPNERTVPQLNIAPLFGAPFMGNNLASYNLNRLN